MRKIERNREGSTAQVKESRQTCEGIENIY